MYLCQYYVQDQGMYLCQYYVQDQSMYLCQYNVQDQSMYLCQYYVQDQSMHLCQYNVQDQSMYLCQYYRFISVSMIFDWIMELFQQSDIVGYSLDRRKGQGISMSELTVQWNWTY